jgi:hypothetical protein
MKINTPYMFMFENSMLAEMEDLNGPKFGQPRKTRETAAIHFAFVTQSDPWEKWAA